ncbi:hypothetical protein BDF22DRAFT_699787 [Syncephalis plumigaleata]|nr:hypothetical protein BDF22DRAFT_699787 [Syncephalis plumigaleata]
MSQTAHVARVKSLYRQALKTAADWHITLDTWRPQALKIRERFEANRNVPTLKEAARLCDEAEKELEEYAHPDPYKFPLAPGGTKWERSPFPMVSNETNS